MKNNKTFIKKWELHGFPYGSAALRKKYLPDKEEKAAVWLTDDAQAARRILAEGACCVYLLTAENRNDFCGGIEWCVQVPEEEMEQPERALREGISDWLPEEFLWRVWLRSRGLPWQICETDRLILREMTEKDLDFLYELQADEEAADFLEALEDDRNVQRQKLTAYRQQMYGFYGFGIWIMEEKESGRPVGRAGLQMRDGFAEPELGFAVLENYRRRGYAEEACRAVLVYAKEELELKKIRMVADQRNKKSRRLCEKLGFVVDNMRKTDNGEWIFYSLQLPPPAVSEADKRSGSI